MNIKKNVNNGYLILSLTGKLDSHTSPGFAGYIENLDDFGEQDVIFDMTSLDYISSAGLRIVLNNSKILKKGNKRLILCGMQDHIKEIFEISGFDSFLEIYDSLENVFGKH